MYDDVIVFRDEDGVVKRMSVKILSMTDVFVTYESKSGNVTSIPASTVTKVKRRPSRV